MVAVVERKEEVEERLGTEVEGVALPSPATATPQRLPLSLFDLALHTSVNCLMDVLSETLFNVDLAPTLVKFALSLPTHLASRVDDLQRTDELDSNLIHIHE